MGYISIKATFYHPVEYSEYLEGRKKLEEVRKEEVEALVDTGSTFPALPEDIVEKLGLPFMGEQEAEVAEGIKKVKLVYAVTQVEDRIAVSSLIVRAEQTTPLIGVVTLEQMGYRVDPVANKLIKGLPFMLEALGLRRTSGRG